MTKEMIGRLFVALGWFLSCTLAVPVFAQSAVADRSALVRFHSPYLGNPGAKVEIVEFFDPACEGCRAFHPFVKKVLDEYRGQVRLIIRYVPFHKNADQVVKLLEAARQQGKYIETLDALLASQPSWAINHVARLDLALQAVARVDLQMDRLKADMAASAVAQIIKQDMKDAVALGVNRTPTFFVNGRLLSPLGYEELRAMVARELQAHGGGANK